MRGKIKLRSPFLKRLRALPARNPKSACSGNRWTMAAHWRRERTLRISVTSSSTSWRAARFGSGIFFSVALLPVCWPMRSSSGDIVSMIFRAARRSRLMKQRIPEPPNNKRLDLRAATMKRRAAEQSSGELKGRYSM